MRAKNFFTSCRENCRFLWRKKSICCSLVTAFILRVPRRIAGRIRAAAKTGCYGSTLHPPSSADFRGREIELRQCEAEGETMIRRFAVSALVLAAILLFGSCTKKVPSLNLLV